ncbi:GyrI-like domain-containing protein [Paenibacillus tianjinensis]|uniref:AraC family transcriptional regulator n=1 Tax=Paenibacillus tianjinensis TaxID=2810347 RepID=A0ABX7LH87_9BACL|nr:GyrI-like domain-containing protein [Paenibacillus tianjinensis]QSF47346.1 AraC family transcriptional regulator [Paenibacillus tianjinensis]
MSTYITQEQKLTLTGVTVRTTNADEAGTAGRLPKLWETYFQSKLSTLTGIRNPHYIYALYTDYESDATGSYTTLIGHEINDERARDDNNFEVVFIPESKYLVFKTRKGPVYEVVAEAWQEIWDYFKESAEVRTYTGDFELYDTRNYDPANTEIEIYIAIE